jgi:hypothetical protein
MKYEFGIKKMHSDNTDKHCEACHSATMYIAHKHVSQGLLILRQCINPECERNWTTLNRGEVSNVDAIDISPERVDFVGTFRHMIALGGQMSAVDEERGNEPCRYCGGLGCPSMMFRRFWANAERSPGCYEREIHTKNAELESARLFYLGTYIVPGVTCASPIWLEHHLRSDKRIVWGNPERDDFWVIYQEPLSVPGSLRNTMCLNADGSWHYKSGTGFDTKEEALAVWDKVKPIPGNVGELNVV